MIKLPNMSYAESFVSAEISAFGGLDLTEAAEGGRYAEAENISLDAYPALSPRKGRRLHAACTAPTSLFSWDGGLVLVDGGSVYYNDALVGTVEPGEKQLAVVNTRLCIFPDKKYIDLARGEMGVLDPVVSAYPGTAVTFGTNTLTMEASKVILAEKTQMQVAYLGQYGYLETDMIKTYSDAVWDGAAWTLTGEQEVTTDRLSDHVGKKVMLQKNDMTGVYRLNTRFVEMTYGTDPVITTKHDYTDHDDRGYFAVITNAEQKEVIPAPYGTFVLYEISYEIKNYDIEQAIAKNRFTKWFSAGDRVTISGCAAIPGNNRDKIAVMGVSDFTLTFADGTFTAGTETGAITVKRPVPDLNFICESSNRLWGVSNSQESQVWNAEKGAFETVRSRVIWASALGDPGNFYAYNGISTDSYAVAVASRDDFTAICAYSGAVHAFKEDKLYKIAGGYPAEYYLTDYDVPGVQSGSHKSLQIINEVLFYKGQSGVYAYTGGQPTLISGRLGHETGSDGVSGSDGRRYYLSMKNSAGDWGIYVYDTVVGQWAREDSKRILDATFLNDVLYLLIGASIYASDDSAGERVRWSVRFPDFDEGTMHRKRYKWLKLRGWSERGAVLEVQITAKGLNAHTVLSFTAAEQGKWQKSIPLPPMRTDLISIRISGTGKSVIYDMTREFSLGGH